MSNLNIISDTMTHDFGGPWTEEKLEILDKYLRAYVKVMKNQRFDLVYVDPFAGTGTRSLKADSDATSCESGGESFPLSRGSAQIALEINPPFDRYVFVEKSRSKVRELRQLVDRYPTIASRVEIINGECNSYLKSFVEKNWEHQRAVVFLDPYGMQVDFGTMEALARTAAMDVWILFPHAIGVNRNLDREGHLEQSMSDRFDALFGTNDWKNRFFGVRSQMELFAGDSGIEKKATPDSIAEYYKERLATVFAHVHPVHRILKNSKDSPMYVLCFALANSSRAARDAAFRIAGHLLEA